MEKHEPARSGWAALCTSNAGMVEVNRVPIMKKDEKTNER